MRSIPTAPLLAAALLELEGNPLIAGGIRLHSVVCRDCDGSGITWAKGLAFTAQDFWEDPDLSEAICEGHYDRPCETCGGARVMRDVDAEYSEPEAVKVLWREIESIAEQRRADAQERYYSTGGL